MISRSVSIIDPDKNYATIIENLLNKSYPQRYTIKGNFQTLDHLKKLRTENPDIVLLEILFPDYEFEDIIFSIKKLVPATNLVILTSQFNSDIVIQALKAGADGFIMKTLDFTSVIGALNESHNGGAAISRMAAKAIVENFRKNTKSVLTRRESEIMNLVSHCKSYREIGQQLSIGKQTARTHIRNIYKKLNVHKKSEAIRLAKQERLIIV